MARIVMLQVFRPQALALALAVGLSLTAVAQAPSRTGVDSTVMRSQWLQRIEQRAAQDSVRKESKGQAAAQAKVQYFNTRVTDFAKSWNKLMKLADQGVWNAKEAKKTREAFERLVKCEAWIEEAKAHDKLSFPRLADPEPESAPK